MFYQIHVKLISSQVSFDCNTELNTWRHCLFLASIAHVELEWELLGTHQFRSVIQSSENKGSFKDDYRKTK